MFDLRTRLRRLRGQRGQALVEMALTLPLLLLVLIGMMEFGLIFNQQLTLTEAAREGARTVALGGSFADGTTRVSNFLPEPYRDAVVTYHNVSDAVIGAKPAAKDPVRVRVTRPYTAFTPLIGVFFGGSIDVSGVATMMVEN